MAVLNIGDILGILYEIKVIEDTLKHLQEEKIKIETNSLGIKEKIEKINNEITEKEKQKNNMHQKEKDLETEIANIDKSIESKQQETATVKTNEAYFKLNKEIEELKNKKSDVESDLLELMYKESEYKKTFENLKKELEENKKELENELNRIKSKQTEIINNIEKYTKEKEEKIQALPENVKNAYLMLKKKYDNPIVFLDNDICEGCNMSNPPQFAVNIKMKQKIEYCQNCGRILLIRPE